MKKKEPTGELKFINCEGHTCTLDSKSCSISAITVCLVSFGKISAGQEARVTSTTLLHASKDSFLICKLSRIMLRSTTLWRMSLTSCNKIKYILSICSWGSPPSLSTLWVYLGHLDLCPFKYFQETCRTRHCDQHKHICDCTNDFRTLQGIDNCLDPHIDQNLFF